MTSDTPIERIHLLRQIAETSERAWRLRLALAIKSAGIEVDLSRTA